MKSCILISFLYLSFFSNLFGQSIFYNGKGQLIADTTYKISKAQLKKIILIEGYLNKHIADYTNYPQKAKDIDDSGYIIVSFKIGTSDTLQDVRIEKAYEKKNYLSNEVKNVIKTIRISKSAYSKHLRNKRYFLAISFQLLGKNYRHPGFIEIKQYKTPIIIRN